MGSRSLTLICFIGVIASITLGSNVSAQELRSKWLLVPGTTVASEKPQPGTLAGKANQSTALRIVPIEGEGEKNNLKRRTARDLIVEVDYENHKPAGGVLVTFASNQKTGLVFSDGSRSIQIATDIQGRATVTGIKPVGLGKFTISISATSSQGNIAAITISQTNVLFLVPAGVLGAVAGGVVATAAGAAVALSHGSHSTAASVATVSISQSGAAGVGAPH